MFCVEERVSFLLNFKRKKYRVRQNGTYLTVVKNPIEKINRIAGDSVHRNRF